MKHETGAAVIMAILLMALVATLAAALLWQQQMWLRETDNMGHSVQATALAQAGADWAAFILATSPRNEVDLLQPWAQRLPLLPMEEVQAGGFLQDEQGLFNLNNLVKQGKTDSHWQMRFQRLLAELNLPLTLANTLADWLDADNIVQSGGAEDAFYLNHFPPYRAANHVLMDVGELRYVQGFDVQTIARLRPFVSALPQQTPINVNTAPPEVLLAMVDGLSPSEARTLVAQRDNQPFLALTDFHQALPRLDINPDPQGLTVTSGYFMAAVTVHANRAQRTIWTLFERGNGAWPHIIWQKAS